MENLVEIENVCFKYDEDLILQEVNLNIAKNSFVGIIGRNGSGKSTLLKLILGILKPVCGHITLNTKKISYIEQLTISLDISFPASVSEIVMLGLYKKIGLFKFPSQKNKQEVVKALEMVGMEKYKNKQLSFLSGGEQQRILIAKALVSDPELLILDEPTTGIDTKSEKDLVELLKNLVNKYNKTIILVSHNISLIKNCNLIYEIKNNKLKEKTNVKL